MKSKLKNIHRNLAMVGFLAAFSIPVLAAEPALAIRVDGNLDDAAWQKARPIEAFKTIEFKTIGKTVVPAGQKPKAQTTGSIMTDSEYLYLGFRCEEPMMDRLEATPFQRDGKLWTNDCIEIYLAPFAREEEYFQIIIDTNGQVFDALKRDDKLDANYDLSIKAQVQKQQNSWTAEVAIPLAELGLSHARSALMNFGRERKPVTENTSWQGAFGKPETWRRMELDLDERYHFDVRDWSFSEATPQFGKNRLEVEFNARPDAPARLHLYVLVDGQWKLRSRVTLPSSSGRTMRVSLPYSLMPQEKPQSVRYVLESERRPVFSSTHRLNLPTDALVAVLALPYYYSEENAGFVRLDSFLSSDSLNSSSIRLTVKEPDGKVHQTKTLSNLQKSMLVGLDISAWRGGTGSVTAELIADGKLMANQDVLVHKRPGPFAKVDAPRP